MKNLDDTQFVYRRKCFVPWSPFETEVTNATKCTDAAHRLQYAEILFRYLSDSYRATLGQSIELAALALISDLGNNRHVAVNHYDEEEEEDEEYRESMEFLILHLKSYMPQRILNLYNDLQLKRLLNRILDEQAHKINVAKQEIATKNYSIGSFEFWAQTQFIQTCRTFFPNSFYDMFFDVKYKQMTVTDVEEGGGLDFNVKDMQLVLFFL